MTDKTELIESKPKEDIGRNGEVFTFPVFGKFPMSKWLEWEDDCNRNYGGARWVKAFADHLKAKHIDDVGVLKARIELLERPEEEKESDGVLTMDGKKH